MRASNRRDEASEETASQRGEGRRSTDYEELTDAYAGNEVVGYASGTPGSVRGPAELEQTEFEGVEFARGEGWKALESHNARDALGVLGQFDARPSLHSVAAQHRRQDGGQ